MFGVNIFKYKVIGLNARCILTTDIIDTDVLEATFGIRDLQNDETSKSIFPIGPTTTMFSLYHSIMGDSKTKLNF